MWTSPHQPTNTWSAPSPLELIQKQITSLYSFFPSQVRVVQPGSAFEIPVTVGPLRVQISLHVTLPNGFPDIAPIVNISPGVAQRWVSHEMRVVGHEGLATWHRNLSLGKVVKDIEIEFNLRPPTIIMSPNQNQRLPTSQAETVSFDEIDSLSANQLKTLLENDVKFEEFFERTTVAKEAGSVQKELLDGNLVLASTLGITLANVLEKNLASKKELDASKERLSELQAILELEDAELNQTNERFKSELLKNISSENDFDGKIQTAAAINVSCKSRFYPITGACLFVASSSKESVSMVPNVNLNILEVFPKPFFYQFVGRSGQRSEFNGTRQDSPRQSQPQSKLPQQAPKPSAEERQPTIRPEDVIKHDLQEIKMEWPLGCYGLNVSWEGGDNIIHGDFSPEELRCEAYAQSRTVGNINAYRQTLAHVLQERQQSMKEIIADPSRGVALGKTPRAVRLQHLQSIQNQALPATTPSAGLQPIHISSLPSQNTATQESGKSDSFSFGGIPELPPS